MKDALILTLSVLLAACLANEFVFIEQVDAKPIVIEKEINGILSIEVYDDTGRRNGTWRTSRDGIQIFVEEYSSGVLLRSKEYYDDGTPKGSVEYVPVYSGDITE